MYNIETNIIMFENLKHISNNKSLNQKNLNFYLLNFLFKSKFNKKFFWFVNDWFIFLQKDKQFEIKYIYLFIKYRIFLVKVKKNKQDIYLKINKWS